MNTVFKGVTWFHRCVIHTLLKVHMGKINKELFEFFKNIDFWQRYVDYANYVNCSMSHLKSKCGNPHLLLNCIKAHIWPEM